jgi:hypothetical protein
VVVLGVVIGVAAIAAGFLIGHSGSKAKATPQFNNSATGGHLQLSYPSSWKLSSSVAAIPGITFASPVLLADAQGRGDLTAGEVSDASGPTLLPKAFRDKVQGTLPQPESVGLGNLQAYRYRDLQLAGLAGPVTVYAVPTSAGVATVACAAASSTASTFATNCDQVAATLRVVDATPYSLAPSTSYADLLSSTFKTLDSSTSGPLSQLKSAQTESAQASASRDVAKAYATAASALSAATVTPMVHDANAAVAAALKQTGDGYTAAADAAQAGNASAYQTASDQIAAGQSALSKANEQLAALGYKVS